MAFLAPVWLLLLIPFGLGLYMAHRQMMGMVRARKVLATGLRSLLATLLVFALAQPQCSRPNRGVATILILDRSDSIPEEARKKQDEFVSKVFSELGEDDAAGVVVVGADAAVESIVAGRRPFAKVLSRVDPRATDLAAAVRLASASFPEGKGRRIVLLSDGNETQGDLLAAAEIASTENVAIDFVALESGKPGEALVSGLEAPTQQPANEPLSLRGLVESSVEQAATLRLERNGLLIEEKTLRLPPGKSAVVFQDRLEKAGFYQYQLSLRGEKDLDVRNNLASAYVSVLSKPRVLVLQMDNGRTLVDALGAQGLDVDLRTPAAIPTRPHQLQNFAAVIFNDLNAMTLTPGQMRMIQQAVRDTGIGFAMVGGENSFLPGGYYGTPIAEALPVDLNIRNRKSFPSTSIAILVDASGSMGAMEDGAPKIRLAAQAAEYTVKLLSPQDRVGVGGSTDGIEIVAPMQTLTNKDAVIEQIRKLSVGGGGIYVRPTVERAEQMLMAETSKVRHFILLADGADCDDTDGVLGIVMRMRASKITTTVVAIGDGKDVPFLKNVAAVGGGRFFLAKRASQLPAIFTQDTSMVARSAIEEGVFFPEVFAGDEMTRGITATPSLKAYCLSELKPLARLGMRTPKKDPLLASWQYGLATSVAFTSDAHPRWAANWVPWDGFNGFWAQVARNISRRNAENAYQVTLETADGRPRLRVLAQDRLGNPRTDWDGKMRIGAPDGTASDAQLTQTAPGIYEAPLENALMGSYMATVAESGPQGRAVSVTGFSVAYPPEFRALGSTKVLLSQAAAVTGGKELAQPEEAIRPLPRPGETRTDLFRGLLLAALLLLVVDVAVRRIAIPVAEIWARIRHWQGLRHSEREEERQTVSVRTERLKRAKTRVRTNATPTPSPFVSEDTPPATTPPSPASQEPARTISDGTPRTTSGSASSTLLERKRARQKAEDENDQEN